MTITVTFNVKPGRELDFQRWAHDITVASARYPGHMGASWLRSGAAYHVIYRFADPARFNGWHDSAERAGFLARLRPIATLVRDEHLTGMETWFEVPQHPGPAAPPRWKMVITTWVGVFPLLSLLQWGLAPHLQELPLILRAMMLSLIVVGLMTYVIMPRLALLLQAWLCR